MRGSDLAAGRGDLGERAWRPAGHVVSAQEANTTILLDVRRGEYYTLNAVGGRVWALLSDGLSQSAIIDRLANEFEASREGLSSDVQAFIEQLSRSKLITD